MTCKVWALPYARDDTAAIETTNASGVGVSLATVCIACIPLLTVHGLSAVLFGTGVAAALTFVTARYARKRLGGWTGDTAGATQVIAEIGFVIGVVAWT